MASIKISDILAEYESKLNGHATSYYFQMANISVKVNPLAFLSTTVDYKGGSYNLEDVAKLYQKDDYTAAIVPDEPQQIISIIKSLKLSHPEYDLEEATHFDEENNKEIRYLLCHMAEVNDDRYDIYVDAINTQHDTTMSKINATTDKTKISASKELKRVNASAEDLKSCDDQINEVEKQCTNIVQESRSDKMKEVDEGHEIYLEKVAKEQQKQAEQQQSRNASLSMDMSNNE